MAIQNSSIDFFKKYLLIVLMTVLLFLVVLEIFIRTFVVTIPKSVPKRISSVYTSNHLNIAVGDSHIFRSFIDQSQYLNLGRGGTTIPVIDLLVRNYFKYRKPEKVIVEASPQLISEIHLQWQDKNHKSYFNLNYWFLPKIYLFEKGIAQQLGSITSWDELKKVLMRDWPDEMDKSDHWVRLDGEERLRRTLSRVEFQEPMIGTKLAENYFNTYRNMLKFLLEKGAQVCVLRTPVDENYLQFIANRKSYQDTLHKFQKMTHELNIKYVDFRKLNMRFDLAAFINQDHLMPNKSKEFVMLVHQACYQ